MSFINLPLLAVLFPLLALPLAVHLFNKKFPKHTLFPDIRIIQKSLAQRSKLFRLRHIILMILRSLAVLLLLFCFLQPVMNLFGSADLKSKNHRNVIIVLDHSLSMNYQGGAMDSRQRSMVELEKIINSLDSEDRVNLIAAGNTPLSCFDSASTNHSEVIGPHDP